MTIDMTNARRTIRKLVDDYGTAITITPMTLAKDKWGDKTETTGTPVVTVGVSFNIMADKFNYQPMGDISDADLIVIIKDDETIAAESGSTRYKVTYESVLYDVVSLEDFDLAGLTLAKQIILKKRD